MYRVQYRSGDQWVVVGRDGQTMCIGTMGQCEDWLDFRENLPQIESAYQDPEAMDFANALAPAASGR